MEGFDQVISVYRARIHAIKRGDHDTAALLQDLLVHLRHTYLWETPR